MKTLFCQYFTVVTLPVSSWDRVLELCKIIDNQITVVSDHFRLCSCSTKTEWRKFQWIGTLYKTILHQKTIRDVLHVVQFESLTWPLDMTRVLYKFVCTPSLGNYAFCFRHKHYLGYGPQYNLYDATAYYCCDGSIFS